MDECGLGRTFFLVNRVLSAVVGLRCGSPGQNRSAHGTSESNCRGHGMMQDIQLNIARTAVGFTVFLSSVVSEATMSRRLRIPCMVSHSQMDAPRMDVEPTRGRHV
jgi:hypothetical protein